MTQFSAASRAVRAVVAAGAALCAWQASAEVSKTEADGIIFERQQVMTQLGKDAETLGKIVAGQVSADKLAETTSALAQGARDSVEAFKPQVPGGHAKPTVWSNYADFTARMDRFASSAKAMADAGKTDDVAKVTGMMIEAMPCKECHDLYREKKQ